MTKRPETFTSWFARSLAAGFAMVVVGALVSCAGVAPRTGQGEAGSVIDTAPKLSTFTFNGEPIASAEDFAPWAAFAAQSRPDQTSLNQCLADKKLCTTPDLLRFRRMLELARGLAPHQQLSLVHHYFNTIEWTNDTRDTWSTLYHTAFTEMGDCEDIALAKYQTLRLLGWPPENLRVVIGWDGLEKDWHAWLAVREADATLLLDSINGLQRPTAYSYARIVYSISDNGVWDHAPNYVPVGAQANQRMVSERAARIAATEGQHNKGALR
jgi:predicted transglutaminase-like cysteine proteinase